MSQEKERFSFRLDPASEGDRVLIERLKKLSKGARAREIIRLLDLAVLTETYGMKAPLSFAGAPAHGFTTHQSLPVSHAAPLGATVAPAPASAVPHGATVAPDVAAPVTTVAPVGAIVAPSSDVSHSEAEHGAETSGSSDTKDRLAGLLG